ncbi:hypothetical protein [Dysgonomonas sp. Marseille-P4361]|uniref:hypothetical protein n=1 Tax=Dysgonomonas sp. Marseille-P4361 TaxID=2161820 RepID=UPI000D54B2AE|nr:hypothetical protein [Dysgonomonas sp. Marseille-P4361]
MKTILLLLVSCFSLSIIAQDNLDTKYRMTSKQKQQLYKKGDGFIALIETYLDENNEALNSGKHISRLSDPSQYIEKAREKAKLYNICVDCYQKEYKTQLDLLASQDRARREKYEKEAFRRDSIFKEETKERNEKISKQFNSKERPYDRFIFAMDMLGEKNGVKHGNFTIFTNMDEELVRTRFSLYLQSVGFTYGDESKKINKLGFIQEYYVRKIAIDKEINDYIQVKYYYTVRNEYPSYYATTLDIDAPCWIVDKVVIDGTANTIINLYISYWAQSRKTIGSDKVGEIATHIFMGDNVSLQYISHNKYRIEITSKNMDYYSSYKILEKYNEL